MDALLYVGIWLLAAALPEHVAAKDHLKVNKCCPEGEVLVDGVKCGKSSKEWKPLVVTNTFTKKLSSEEVGELLRTWELRIGRPGCEGDEREEFVRLENREFLFLDNGSLWYEGDFLPPGSFCLDDDSVVVCVKNEHVETASLDTPPAEQVRKVIIKKCCANKEIYTSELWACSMHSYSQPVTLSRFLQHTTSLSVLNITNTFLETGFPPCKDGYIMTGRLSDHNSSLQQDGSLYLPTAKVVLEPKTFCLDYVEEEKHDIPTVFTCPDYLPVPVNGSHIAPEQGDIRFTLYPLALFVSVFFLAATLAAGYLMPTTHHMLHWRCQTCHVACLMMADFLLAVTQIAGHTFPHQICAAFAILMHVLFLAAFFWLNTMCFNIWWTFRDLRPTSLDKSQEVWRLRMYEIYAWGVPLIIATVALVFDHLPPGSFPSILKPKFAVKSCWFHGDLEIFTYFFGPVGILLFLNLVLFALTARELTCGLWRSEVVKSTTERATLGKVCLKLVVVMGITWIADVTSWAIGGSGVWYVTDIINALQGLFIFIVVGCQPQIWTIVKRLWCFRESATTSTNGNQQSCSQDVPSLGDSTLNNTQNTSLKTPVNEVPSPNPKTSRRASRDRCCSLQEVLPNSGHAFPERLYNSKNNLRSRAPFEMPSVGKRIITFALVPQPRPRQECDKSHSSRVFFPHSFQGFQVPRKLHARTGTKKQLLTNWNAVGMDFMRAVVPPGSTRRECDGRLSILQCV